MDVGTLLAFALEQWIETYQILVEYIETLLKNVILLPIEKSGQSLQLFSPCTRFYATLFLVPGIIFFPSGMPVS